MSFKSSILIFLTINCLIIFVNCARILCVAPIPAYSHQIVYRPVWEALAKKGHDLVVLTTDPWETQNLTNIKQIDLSSTYKLWKDDLEITEKLMNMGEDGWIKFEQLTQLMDTLMDKELEYPPVKKLLNDKNEHFDLVIVEYVFPTMFAFSNHFNCPYVGIVSMDLQTPIHSLFGNPAHPLLYPCFMLRYDSSLDMTAAERLHNVIMALSLDVYGLFCGFSGAEITVEKHFGKNLPPLLNIMKNVSLILMNTNSIFNKRPLGPATIAFGGGVQLQPPKPLPKDLLKFLNGATNGFIYFSFGSSIDERHIDPKMRQIFLNVFQKLPYRVLWKFDAKIPNLPKNVLMRNWVPQQDVLRHPKIKLFITQGGLQSVEETIFMNVPSIIVPLLADQRSNANKMMRFGIAQVLDKDSLNEDQLRKAIEEIVNNEQSYKTKITGIAELLRDQPGSNVDKAVWWIEYVLRHNGAKHLHNKVAMELPFYQYYFLDILAFFLLCLYHVRVIHRLIQKGFFQ